MFDREDSVVLRRNVRPGTPEASIPDPQDTEEVEETSRVRLSLMEEIILLGLKDREGHLSYWNDSVSCGLRGCMLVELGFNGRITLEQTGMRRRKACSRTVVVKNPLPTGDALLDEALKLIKQNEPQCVKTWIEYLSGESWSPFKIHLQMRNVRERVAKSLVEKGICTTEKQNLILFDMMTHPLVDHHAKHRLIRRIHDVLINKWNADVSKLEKRSLALICLAHYSDVLDNALSNLPDSDYDLARKRVSSLIQHDFTTESSRDDTLDVLWAVCQSLND